MQASGIFCSRPCSHWRVAVSDGEPTRRPPNAVKLLKSSTSPVAAASRAKASSRFMGRPALIQCSPEAGNCDDHRDEHETGEGPGVEAQLGERCALEHDGAHDAKVVRKR